MEKISRMLTPLEHRFLNAPNARVSFIVRVEGKITEDKFRTVIKKVRQLHPLLGIKIKYDENHQSWFTQEKVPDIQIRVVPRTDDNQWKAEMNKEFIKYSEPTEEPLIRFVLLLGDDISEFIIFGNHGICDGMSMKNLTRDIMTYLANPEKEVEAIFSPPMNYDYVNGLKQPGGLMKFIGKKLVGSWEKNPAYFEPKHFKTSHIAFFRNYHYNLVHKRLTQDQTQIFLDKCRAEGVTINSGINAAFRAALDKYDGYKKHRDNISIAVNIRDEMKVDNKEFYGFAVSSIRTSFKYDQKLDFWTNTRNYHKIVSKKLKKKEYIKDLAGGFILSQTMNDGMLVGGIGYLTTPEDPGYEEIMKFRNDESNMMIKILKKKGLYTIGKLMTGIVSTNLGRLDIPTEYGDYKIDSIIFAPSAHPIMEIVPGINTINGKLDITLGSYSKKEDDQTEKLEKIMEIALALIFQQ